MFENFLEKKKVRGMDRTQKHDNAATARGLRKKRRRKEEIGKGYQEP